MDQIYPDDGLELILTSIVANGLNYHLFMNDFTPGLSDHIADYTEAAWSGYAPITVPSTAFTFYALSAHVAQVTSDAILFPNTSGMTQQVYGYYVTDLANAVLIAAARFDGAPLLIPDGSNVPVLPGVANFSSLST